MCKLQAYAAAKFADACLRALKGEAGIIQCAYVDSRVGIKNLLSIIKIILNPLPYHNLQIQSSKKYFFLRINRVSYYRLPSFHSLHQKYDLAVTELRNFFL